MRIQFVSDLHLECHPKTTFETLLEPKAPVLALLGDIAPVSNPNLRRFLEWCSERWETVLYVPGNMELFDAPDIDASLVALKRVCAPYQNVHVLYRDVFYSSDGFVVLGCTFWSCIPNAPVQHRARHFADLNWLKEELRRYTNPALVLSYYGPTLWVQNEDRVDDPAKTHIIPEIEIILRTPIVAWIFGHVHTYVEYWKVWSSADSVAHSVLLLANGLGEAAFPADYRNDAVVALS